MIRKHDPIAHKHDQPCDACDEARWENRLDRIAEQDEARGDG